MNPTADSKTGDFSPCSIRDICSKFPAVAKCLQRAPARAKILSITICGNGLKEQGEDCDCGTAENCAKDKCCTTDCKFKNGAVCDDKNDGCCQDCQIKPAQSVCRPSASICDLEETCDGSSMDCPPDLFVQDGTSCDSHDRSLKCASGNCTSRAVQCVSRVNQLYKFTAACPTWNVGATCILTCMVQNGTCFQLNGVFVDGSECGNGGTCKSGACEGDSPFNNFDTYIKANIWIPIVFGVLIAMCIFSCIFQYCRQRRAAQAYKAAIVKRMQAGIGLEKYTYIRRGNKAYADQYEPYGDGPSIGYPVPNQTSSGYQGNVRF